MTKKVGSFDAKTVDVETASIKQVFVAKLLGN